MGSCFILMTPDLFLAGPVRDSSRHGESQCNALDFKEQNLWKQNPKVFV